jgi:hypothetical protein
MVSGGDEASSRRRSFLDWNDMRTHERWRLHANTQTTAVACARRVLHKLQI